MNTVKLIIASTSIIFGISMNAHAEKCYEASIVKPTPFMGNDGEILKLSDGTLWEVKYEYEYMYEYNPDVIICPDSQRLIIDDTELDVQPLN
mgnify:CR=1 FL=1